MGKLTGPLPFSLPVLVLPRRVACSTSRMARHIACPLAFISRLFRSDTGQGLLFPRCCASLNFLLLKSGSLLSGVYEGSD
jgi:hypothetical protein